MAYVLVAIFALMVGFGLAIWAVRAGKINVK